MASHIRAAASNLAFSGSSFTAISTWAWAWWEKLRRTPTFDECTVVSTLLGPVDLNALSGFELCTFGVPRRSPQQAINERRY